MSPKNPLTSPHVNEMITLRNQQDSALLRLPPELRNQIYEHVFGGLQICPGLLMPGRYAVWVRTKSAGLERPWDHPERVQFLQSCRQIYEEAALLAFKLNEFYLNDFSAFYFFTTDLTDNQRHAIESVTFSFGDSDMRTLGEWVFHYWRIAESSSSSRLMTVTEFDVSQIILTKIPFMKLPMKLPGLQRIVAELPGNHISVWETKVRQMAVEVLVKQWGASDGVSIVFKE